jgi:hypothetical protein
VISPNKLSITIAITALLTTPLALFAGPMMDFKLSDSFEMVSLRAAINVQYRYKNLEMREFPRQSGLVDFFGHLSLAAALPSQLPLELTKYPVAVGLLERVVQLTIDGREKKANKIYRQLVSYLGATTTPISLNQLNQRITLMTMEKSLPYLIFQARRFQSSKTKLADLQEDLAAFAKAEQHLNRISLQERMDWEEMIREVRVELRRTKEALRIGADKVDELFLNLQMAAQMESRRFNTLSNAAKLRHDVAMSLIRNIRD